MLGGAAGRHRSLRCCRRPAAVVAAAAMAEAIGCEGGEPVGVDLALLEPLACNKHLIRIPDDILSAGCESLIVEIRLQATRSRQSAGRRHSPSRRSCAAQVHLLQLGDDFGKRLASLIGQLPGQPNAVGRRAPCERGRGL